METSQHNSLLWRNGSFGLRLLVTIWAASAVAWYFLGLLLKWGFWGVLGVGMAPLHTAQLFLPIFYAFNTLEPWAARIAVLVYLGIHGFIVVRSGWLFEEGAALAMWPIVLPPVSGVTTALVLAPFAGIYVLWSSWRPATHDSADYELVSPAPSPVLSPDLLPRDRGPLVRHGGSWAKAAVWLGTIAAVLTIASFLIDYVL